jgi:peptidoglycan/xylan/chitin deacetylase (PgdA/CDA1 family)
VYKRLPVFDVTLSYLMWKAPGRTFSLPGLLPTMVTPERHECRRRGAIQADILKRSRASLLSADDKHALLCAMAGDLHIDLDRLISSGMFHIMTESQVRALDSRLVDVQLHTHRHRTPEDPGQFAREIQDNREAIEALRGPGAYRHFCYPAGQYVPEQVRLLRTLGVVSATTCNPGIASASTDPMLLPRLIDTESVTPAKFAAWAHGTGALLRRALER